MAGKFALARRRTDSRVIVPLRARVYQPGMPFALPPFRLIWQTALMLTIGALGGALAQWLHWPMPWMLGALLTTALIVRLPHVPFFQDYTFPLRFRTFFIGLIGVMIGAQVTPDLLGLARELPWTLSALVVFVLAAHFGNIFIFHGLGGMDRATAVYAGTPGGLMESIVFGEAAGADVRVLTLQQFLRVTLVITALPVGLSLWLGHPVGSAAGVEPAGHVDPVDGVDLLLISITAVVGLVVAQAIRLPAAQITGPLLLAAAATMVGLWDLHLPFWLIATAQLVIGVSLGMRFQGVDAAMLLRAFGLSLVSVGYMLLLGLGFALFLQAMTGIAFLHLFIAFAPGGVAEMGVVALSLAANPALVSLHHVLRILITVGELPLVARAMGVPPKS